MQQASSLAARPDSVGQPERVHGGERAPACGQAPRWTRRAVEGGEWRVDAPPPPPTGVAREAAVQFGGAPAIGAMPPGPDAARIGDARTVVASASPGPHGPPKPSAVVANREYAVSARAMSSIVSTRGTRSVKKPSTDRQSRHVLLQHPPSIQPATIISASGVQ